MKLRRRYRIVVLSIAGLLVLWLIYYAAISVVYGFKLRSLRAQVEAEGSSLDLAKLVSQHGRRHLEAKDNAAYLYRAAGSLMDMRTGPHVPEVDSYSAFTMPMKPGERAKVVTDKRPGLETWLRDSAIELQLLHRGAQYEHAWFDLDYSEGFRMKLPHYSQMREGARLLMLESWLAAEKGDAHTALQATWTALRLRRATEDDPILVSPLLGMATDSVALSTLQEILRRIDPQAQDLRLILTEVQSRDRKSFQRAMEGERACGAMVFDKARKEGIRSVLRMINDVSGTPDKRDTRWPLLLSQVANALPSDEYRYLSAMNHLVATAAQLDTMPFDEAERRTTAWIMTENLVGREGRNSLWWKSCHPLSYLLVPALSRAYTETRRDFARHDVAQCGIAAELYRLDHGVYPPNLEALVPKYLGILPKDIFSGRPLLLESLRNGVLISSVGPYVRGPGDSESVPPIPPIEWRVERKTAEPARNP